MFWVLGKKVSHLVLSQEGRDRFEHDFKYNVWVVILFEVKWLFMRLMFIYVFSLCNKGVIFR